MPQRLRNLKITRIALVHKGINPGAHVMLYKSAPPPEEETMETVTKAAHDARVAELEASIATLTAEVTTLTKGQPPAEEDIWKGISPVLKARFEAQERALAAAKEAAAVEKAARDRVVHIAKARSYQHLPINADDDWELFQDVAQHCSATTLERLDTILKGADELGRRAALTTQRGRTVLEGAGDESPLGQLETLARTNVSKGRAKSLEEGMDQAIRERPELYRAHSLAVQNEERG